MLLKFSKYKSLTSLLNEEKYEIADKVVMQKWQDTNEIPTYCWQIPQTTISSSTVSDPLIQFANINHADFWH